MAMPSSTLSSRPLTVITGASRGIGRAIALRLAQERHVVALGYATDRDAADAVAAQIRDMGGTAIVARVDVTHEGSIETFVEGVSKHGAITGVVANAGAVRAIGKLVDANPADIRRDLDLNLLGTILTCRAAIPHLERTQGSIVTISSAAARLGSPHTYVHYAAAKAGVEALTVGLARELGPQGIRVNCVAPGTVVTDFHHDPSRPERVGATVPLGRPGQPEEIAGAVAWLLSADASYATGTTIGIDGGL
jgi:NAD(P)-dependent dehydrogenase (short-subunit alcohol dehydrogenase family)